MAGEVNENARVAGDLVAWLHGVDVGVDDEEIESAIKDALDRAEKRGAEAIWPFQRRRQLGNLEELLRLVRGLDMSTGFLRSAERIITLEKMLGDHDLSKDPPDRLLRGLPPRPGPGRGEDYQ